MTYRDFNDHLPSEYKALNSIRMFGGKLSINTHLNYIELITLHSKGVIFPCDNCFLIRI